MKQRVNARVTILTYSLVLTGLLVIVGVAARDVLFERYTFRVGATISSDSDLVYIVSGRTRDGEDYRDILVADPERKRIGHAKGLDTTAIGFAAAGVPGGLLIAGGSSTAGYLDTIYSFSAVSEEIRRIGTLPFPIGFGAAAAVDGAVYIVGGYDGQARRSEIVRIDPDTGATLVTGTLPEPRDGHSVVAWKDRLFVLGGETDGNHPVSNLLELDPASGTLIRTIALRRTVSNTSMAIDGSNLIMLRLTRSSMLESLGQDYIRTALAKGASQRTIHRVHARRNALIPVVTVSGVLFAGLMAGLVITETIFNRKGIGFWMARAALQLDVPAIMFNVMFLGVVFVVVNLIVDILYAYIDPRIRLG